MSLALVEAEKNIKIVAETKYINKLTSINLGVNFFMYIFSEIPNS